MGLRLPVSKKKIDSNIESSKITVEVKKAAVKEAKTKTVLLSSIQQMKKRMGIINDQLLRRIPNLPPFLLKCSILIIAFFLGDTVGQTRLPQGEFRLLIQADG